MRFIIQRRWDRRYMKEFFAWVLEPDGACEFPDREAALRFCSEHKLLSVDVVQRGDDSKNDLVVQSIP